MSYLLILLTAIWPVGQLGLIDLGHNLRLNLLDLIVIFALLQTLLSGRLIFNKLNRALLFAAGSFALATFISWFIFANIGLAAFLYLTRFCVYAFLIFYFQKESPENLKRATILSLTLFCLLGLVQYLFFPDVRALKFVGFDDHYYRLIGTFFDPNYTSLIFVIASLVCLSLPGKKRLLSFIPLTLLALTFSRAGYLTFAFGLLSLVVAKRNFKFLLLFLFLAVAIYLIPKPFGEGVNLWRSFSITSRLHNQSAALQSFVKSPLFGHGFNHFKESTSSLSANLSSGVDNSFLFVAETTGLIGLVPFLYFLFQSFKSIRGMGRIILGVILFHSLFNNSFFYSWIFVAWLATLRIYQSKD